VGRLVGRACAYAPVATSEARSIRCLCRRRREVYGNQLQNGATRNHFANGPSNGEAARRFQRPPSQRSQRAKMQPKGGAICELRLRLYGVSASPRAVWCKR